MPENCGRKKKEQKIDSMRECSTKIALAAESSSQRNLCYMAKEFVAFSLPNSNPVTDAVTKKNGYLWMTISTNYTLPSGIYPRLILLWLCSRVTLTKSRNILLGERYVDFLRKVCPLDKNGKPSSHQCKNVMIQLKRLLATTFDLQRSYEKPEKKAGFKIAVKADLWGKSAGRDERGYIVLSQDFYNLVIKSPVPLDSEAIKTFGSSSFELDVFMWVTWRVLKISSTSFISYKLLHEQFGSRQQRLYDFKRTFLNALERIKILWL
jgi:hypothetical protein